MADFVAVIRRAVDGLNDNTPEMRAKVYEKARGAVLRQLESMKPRPPEEMLRRQIDKLEAAIQDVEGEHAEALAPLDTDTQEYEPEDYTDAADHPADGDVSAPQDEAAEAEARAGQSHADAVAAQQQYYDEWDDTHPVATPAVQTQEEVRETVAEPQHHAEPEAPADVEEETPVAAVPEELFDAPEARRDEVDTAEPLPEAVAEPEDEPARAADAVAEEDPAAHREEPEWYEPVEAVAEPEPEVEQPAWADEPEVDAEPEPVHSAVEHDPAAFHEQAPISETHYDAHHFPEWVDAEVKEPAARPAAAVVEVWPEDDYGSAEKAAEEKAPHQFGVVQEDLLADTQPVVEPEQPAKMPAAPDLLAWDDSPFDDVPAHNAGADPKNIALDADVDLFAERPVEPPQKVRAEAGGKDAWNDLEDLIGFDRSAAAKDTAADRDIPPPDLDSVVASRQAKPFRVEPRRRFNFVPLILAVLGLAIVGGGAYAAWLNREALNKMVADLISSAPAPVNTAEKPAEVSTQETAPASTQTADTSKSLDPVPAADGNATDKNATEVAALNDGTTINKFTQRLQTDGSEVDEGPAIQPGDTATVEGKSVAEQNVAAVETPTVEAGQAVSETVTSNGTVTTDKLTQEVPPAGASQKMLIYEERLGQSVPTAIEGGVVWSVQQEVGANGKEEPTIQGQINVADRGLSALITFKRNSDPSLPASHLVEIVFSLPKDFEGGSIDSVQRIAMKQTEQDRGNALIAVPAKITDDFHMIALNDFPDAMKSNLELMRTRNWIDIPITYRNGRRALLTMEKGPTGTEAFNTAIKAWAALGNAPGSGQ